ncbi:hypothetical protein GIB67_008672, partial [Kingdonia uniflora]
WLPAWLQPPQEPLLSDHSKYLNTTTCSPQLCKDSAWKAPNIFTVKEAIFNSCHLFLSGDENLQDGTTQSSGNLSCFCASK